MTDRELLEMAAKAEGRKLEYMTVISSRSKEEFIAGWNPLHDDGDALRLAVKLGIVVDTTDGVLVQYIKGGVSYPLVDYEAHYPFSAELDEACAVVRRLIVRAAAEIGKAMP